jgi:hypothetical protein
MAVAHKPDPWLSCLNPKPIIRFSPTLVPMPLQAQQQALLLWSMDS